MGNGPDVPGEWDSSGPSEPPAQLLRRAISHVESLLNRLENPADQSGAEPPVAFGDRAPSPDRPPGQAGVDESDATEPPAAADDDSSDVSDINGTNVVELARAQTEADEVLDERPADRTHVGTKAPQPDYVPLAGVSSTAQAEALRITLHAHEEAHRLRAEANSLRAEAAAEGERILIEARMLSDRLHVESREGATELLAAAKSEAEAIIEAARAEADRITQAARDDSVTARAEVAALAEQERAVLTAAARAEADRDAEQIRAAALDQGRAEAARLVEAEVAAAAIESRRAVEASRSRADELLAAASSGIEDVRGCMRRLLEEMNQALVAFNSSVGSVEALRDAVAELAPSEEAPDGTIAEGRRPLGLLFGAPHA